MTPTKPTGILLWLKCNIREEIILKDQQQFIEKDLARQHISKARRTLAIFCGAII
jgi:hypothetical protein